jgi:hypothetical protein
MATHAELGPFEVVILSLGHLQHGEHAAQQIGTDRFLIRPLPWFGLGLGPPDPLGQRRERLIVQPCVEPSRPTENNTLVSS